MNNVIDININHTGPQYFHRVKIDIVPLKQVYLYQYENTAYDLEVVTDFNRLLTFIKSCNHFF